MLGSRLPDLTFPMVTQGKHQTPWNLHSLLYLGGAGTRTDHIAKKINTGKLGKPITERIALVSKIHENIVVDLS